MVILRVRLDEKDIGDANLLAVNEYRRTVIRKAIEKATNFDGARMFGPFEMPTVELQLSNGVEVDRRED